MTDEEFENEYNKLLNDFSEEELRVTFRDAQKMLKEASNDAMRENLCEGMRVIRRAIMLKMRPRMIKKEDSANASDQLLSPAE